MHSISTCTSGAYLATNESQNFVDDTSKKGGDSKMKILNLTDIDPAESKSGLILGLGHWILP